MDTPSLFDNLTPEQLAALLQGSSLQEEGGWLERQLAELNASAMPHQQHTTALGAGLGGLAEALDTGVNAYHAKALRGKRDSNLEAQRKMMGDFGALMRTPKQAPAGIDPRELAAFPGSAPPMLSADVLPPGESYVPQSDVNPPYPTGASALELGDNWGMDLSDPQHRAALMAADPTVITPQWGLDLTTDGQGLASIPPGSSSGGLPSTMLPQRRDRGPQAFMF